MSSPQGAGLETLTEKKTTMVDDYFAFKQFFY
jgi:hypothetical protein